MTEFAETLCLEKHERPCLGIRRVRMVVVNFKIVMGAGDRGPDWLVSLVGLLEGRAAATFVVLAGAGLSLLSGKGRTLQPT